jgi:SAM-dependent methyltransferase
MRRFLITDLYAGNEVAYRRRQVPAFHKSTGREPQSYREVKGLMDKDPYYRAFSLLNRATQELLWDTVGESVERQLPALIDAATHVAPAGGSLTLDPDFALPDYATKVDIHVMPGSFHKELGPDDVYAGAVDIAAPMLRYAHARSEAMGVPVHYSQQNAGYTNFEDGSFDLILSNLLLHEIPQKLTKQIIRECHRLLAPGGVHVHNDMVGWPTDAFQEFMAEWNSHHNNEPFERGSGTLDWKAACIDAGFLAEDVFLQPIGAAYMAEQLAFVGYRGAQRR